MRLQELENHLRYSYGETEERWASASEANAVPASTRQASHQQAGEGSGDDDSAKEGNADKQATERAAEQLERRMAEQGVQLKFTVVQSEKGTIEIEVTDKQREKVLMRIPPKGVLTVSAEGKTIVGTLLSRHF